MSGALRAVLRKELRLELRTLAALPAMLLFAVSLFVLAHFTLNRSVLEGDLAAGVLWISLLLASLLGANRLFVADVEQGGLEGFMLAPVERSVLLLAKTIVMLVFLTALELVAVPAFAVLLLGPALGPALGWLVVLLLLADIGIALIAVLVSALAARTRARDLFVALIGLPLLLPIAIGGARGSAPLLTVAAHAPAARWLLMLGLYDLILGLIAFALFDFLVEE
jgi:heme exporter protein B